MIYIWTRYFVGDVYKCEMTIFVNWGANICKWSHPVKTFRSGENITKHI
jgi:hypothetical protein